MQEASGNLQKYNQAFIDNLSVKTSDLSGNLAYNQTPTWDSIGHMSLIAALEEAFGISFDTDDIINFSSYTVGKEILSRYGVKL